MKILNKTFLGTILISTSLFAGNVADMNDINCENEILEKEKEIIKCTYIAPYTDIDRTVTFNWIEPNGEVSRTRDINITKNHRSVYDYRFKNGRTIGKWNIQVIDKLNNNNITSEFNVN